jgi:hypothetical protein
MKMERKKGKWIPTKMEGGKLVPKLIIAMYIPTTVHRSHEHQRIWAMLSTAAAACDQYRHASLTSTQFFFFSKLSLIDSLRGAWYG